MVIKAQEWNGCNLELNYYANGNLTRGGLLSLFIIAIVILAEAYPCLGAGSLMQHGTMQLRSSACGYTAALLPNAGCLPEASLAGNLLLTATVRIHVLQQPKMLAR